MELHGGEFRPDIGLVDPSGHSPGGAEGDEQQGGHLPDADQILHGSNASHSHGNGGSSHLLEHGGAGSHHPSLIALEDEVVYGHPQGSRCGRIYKKSNWVVEEMLILQAAKREDLHRHEARGAKGTQNPAQERWSWIEDYCWASGAHRSAQQCHDKWEVISTAYKKVYNNEKYVCNGQKSYWTMTPEERKRNKLPPNFQKEIFNALLEWCNTKSKNSDSGELVVDTSGPLGPSPGVKAEMVDSEDESGEETSGPNQTGKKRKWNKMDEGLATILVRNNKNVVEALLESEDRKDKRHREDIEMERVKLELEKEKFRGAMKLGSGYIDALVNIGDGLKQLSAALCSNMHT